MREEKKMPRIMLAHDAGQELATYNAVLLLCSREIVPLRKDPGQGGVLC